jgi:transcriptional regulator with XRE-family HTH domain
MTDSPRLRRQLRSRLRKVRAQAELATSDVESMLGWAHQQLTRVESGQSVITAADLRHLLEVYGVTASDEVEQLLALAAAVKQRPWRQYADIVPPGATDFFGLESSAVLIRHYEPHLVPGLLQTPQYTRALMSDAIGLDDVTAQRSVEVRAQRQEILQRQQLPEMYFIVSEAAVRQQVGGPEVMAQQIEHIRSLCARLPLSFQIVPFERSAHPGMLGPFVVFEFDSENDHDVLYLEAEDHRIIQDDDSPLLHSFINRFWLLEQIALTPAESLDRLSRFV